MMSREEFDRLPEQQKLGFLFDETVQLRNAGLRLATQVQDLVARLQAIENRRQDTP